MFTKLAKKLFSKREPSMRFNYLLWALQTRAWICLGGINLVRVFQYTSKSGKWFQEHEICSTEPGEREASADTNCVYKFNSDLLESADFFKITILVLTMLALLFCILCCKWRVLANYCLYFECVTRTCAWFVPNSNSEKLTTSNLTTLSVIYFLSFYCD